MRRSSIITIILLVLVIIGLTVALVVTNLPDKKQVEDNSIIEKNDSEEDNKVKSEEPKQVALEGEVTERIYKILSMSESYYKVKNGEATRKDLDNNEVQRIAYDLYIKDNYEKLDTTYVNDYMVAGKFSKKEMDEAIKKVYGDMEYIPSIFGNGIIPLSTYVEAEQTYYVTAGYGGGGYFSYPIKGIIKIEEYSDRYEAYEEYLYAQSSSFMNTTKYILKGWHSDFSKSLFDFEAGRVSDLYDSVADVEPQNIYVGKVETVDERNVEYIKANLLSTQKVLTKYQDEATIYKHTFIKNDDGTFYWYKSEIVK